MFQQSPLTNSTEREPSECDSEWSKVESLLVLNLVPGTQILRSVISKDEMTWDGA